MRGDSHVVMRHWIQVCMLRVRHPIQNNALLCSEFMDTDDVILRKRAPIGVQADSGDVINRKKGHRLRFGSIRVISVRKGGNGLVAIRETVRGMVAREYRGGIQSEEVGATPQRVGSRYGRISASRLVPGRGKLRSPVSRMGSPRLRQRLPLPGFSLHAGRRSGRYRNSRLRLPCEGYRRSAIQRSLQETQLARPGRLDFPADRLSFDYGRA